MTNDELRTAADDVIEWYAGIRVWGGSWGDLANKIVALARHVKANSPATTEVIPAADIHRVTPIDLDCD